VATPLKVTVVTDGGGAHYGAAQHGESVEISFLSLFT